MKSYVQWISVEPARWDTATSLQNVHQAPPRAMKIWLMKEFDSSCKTSSFRRNTREMVQFIINPIAQMAATNIHIYKLSET